MCNILFSQKDTKRYPVTDHSHYERSNSGYRARICSSCNHIRRKESYDSFYVAAHNGSSFDLNFAMVEICKSFENNSPLVSEISVVSSTDDSMVTASFRAFCKKCHLFDPATRKISKKFKKKKAGNRLART